MRDTLVIWSTLMQARTQDGCSPPPYQIEIKETDFVDTIISNILPDLPFC
jgi:hypothetical protein